MKKLYAILLTALTTLSIQAAPSPEVLSKAALTIYGSELSLPTVKNADGTICKSYVAGAKREEDVMVVKIGKACGAATKVSNDAGGFDYYPAGMTSAQEAVSDGEVMRQLARRLEQSQVVLSKSTVTIGGNEISLPTVKNVDGTICKSFISEVKHNDDAMTVKIGKTCGASVAALALHPAK